MNIMYWQQTNKETVSVVEVDFLLVSETFLDVIPDSWLAEAIVQWQWEYQEEWSKGWIESMQILNCLALVLVWKVDPEKEDGHIKLQYQL